MAYLTTFLTEFKNNYKGKMKDILQDIVSHTHSLGFLHTLKITTNDTATNLTTVADDKSIIFNAQTHDRIAEFNGTFGLGNMATLSLLLKNPEYKDDATIEIVQQQKDGMDYPAHIHFENCIGDFQNDFRFINKEIIEQKCKSATFKGANWDVEFEPPVASITRMKLMGATHSDEIVFSVTTHNDNLVFSFGDTNNHAGEFVFKHNVGGTLATTRSYPLAQVQSILSLSGNQVVSISNDGVMKISVDSGLATYEYILPAQSK